jgi:adenylate cyclase
LLLIFCSLLLSPQVYAQEANIPQLEDNLKRLQGLKRLKALNRLTAHYQDSTPRKAIRFARQAANVSGNISYINNPEAQEEIARAFFQLGKIHFDKENYFVAQKHFQTVVDKAQGTGGQDYIPKSQEYLSEIDALVESGAIKENFLTKALKDIDVRETINNTSKDVQIQGELIAGKAQAKAGNYKSAIKHYENAIGFLREKGDEERINELQLKVAMFLDSLDKPQEAQAFLDKALKKIEQNLEKDVLNIEEERLAEIEEVEGISEEEIQESMRVEQKKFKEIAETFAKQKNFEKSLAYYKLYQELSQKMVEDSLSAITEAKQRESELVLLQQQKQIADLKVQSLEEEKAKQVRLRNTYLSILLLILASAVITFYFYTTKKKEHKKLTIAYRDLDKTKNKLVNAEQKIVKLLSQQVSGDVAKELLRNNAETPVERRFTCIMFLDIRDFTPTVEKLSPEEIIDYQNNVFGFMIDIVQKYNGTINQLLGDGFMATFGAPVSHGNDCQNAFAAANEVLQEIKDRNEAGLIKKTRVGIGLHAGYVVTGNVGNDARKQYSVTGNPVIIASRVEQLNKTYKSQLIITEEVYNKLDQPITLSQPFLEVLVKGRSNPVKILKIA